MAKDYKFIAVVGSRKWDKPQLIIDTLDQLEDFILVSGGANGVDTYAEHYCRVRFKEKKYLFPYIIYPDYNSYGKRAPLIRNRHIAEICHYMIAFWMGDSRGTANAIEHAITLKKTVEIIYYDGRPTRFVFPENKQEGFNF